MSLEELSRYRFCKTCKTLYYLDNDVCPLCIEKQKTLDDFGLVMENKNKSNMSKKSISDSK